MKLVRFLAGFVWGALVGAGVALLFVPESGAETQRRIQDWAQEIRTAGQEAAEQKRLELTAQLEELKQS